MDTQYNKNLIYRAGTIPYIVENNQIQMLFMRPTADFTEFLYQIGKGKVEEEDETHLAAALREGKEELGLFVGNIILTEEVGIFMGRTTIFVNKIKNKDLFGLPSDETESTRWMTMEEFEIEGRPLHVPVVQSAIRLIQKIENMW